jgi:hypothetical protein
VLAQPWVGVPRTSPIPDPGRYQRSRWLARGFMLSESSLRRAGTTDVDQIHTVRNRQGRDHCILVPGNEVGECRPIVDADDLLENPTRTRLRGSEQVSIESQIGAFCRASLRRLFRTGVLSVAKKKLGPINALRHHN